MRAIPWLDIRFKGIKVAELMTWWKIFYIFSSWISSFDLTFLITWDDMMIIFPTKEKSLQIRITETGVTPVHNRNL